jgi:ethanolamine utilization protein EutS
MDSSERQKHMGDVFEKDTQRVIEESVPGKQVTMAHVVASPVSDIYDRLGIDEAGAIGILAISPYETAIIAADIATKAADVTIGFLDRFTGSVVLTGDVQSVETALKAVNERLHDLMGFDVCEVTRT